MLTVDASSVHAIELEVWRAVEAQHRVSTMILVKTLDEQFLLEQILESSKPALPEDFSHLHWLLFTPFRYPPLPNGSRFRGPSDPGVFYGADVQRTACAELGYWRWRFLMDSELDAIDPLQQTLFKVALKGKTIDLRFPPYVEQKERWMHPTDYAHCREVAYQARENHVEIIRYESVRDPEYGACAAVLSHIAFAKHAPIQTQTWNLSVTRTHITWQEDSIFNGDAFEFDATRWIGR
jgi:hypothetical protein